jgi:type I restriction enzyme S subunit
MAVEGWKETTLGEFVTLQRGHDLPEGQRQPGRIPILGSFGITGFHNEAKTTAPGVTVGRSGASFGVVNYSPVDFWPLNTALYVTDFHGNDPRFAYYFLHQFDFKQYNSGSAQPSLNRNFIHPIPVAVPPLPEQRAIAHILGSLDDKIELNRSVIDGLGAIARALFKSWFVDFDPVRAKATGKDTNLPEFLADLFPASFVESELGEIPKGWAIKSLDELTSYLNRGVSPAYVEEGGVLVLNQKCIRGGRVDTAKGRRHDAAKKSIAGRALVTGDILVNSTGVGTLGRVAQIADLDEETVVDSHVTVVRANGVDATWNFLGLALCAREAEIEALGEGSTGQTELSRSRLGRLPVTTPRSEVLTEFDRLCLPLRKKIATNERSTRTLTSVRDTLLPKLISGEVRVTDAERIVRERI